MDWSNLKADYERLGSYSAVAREYGVTKGRVAQQAKAQGINPQPEGRSLRIDWSGLPALYDSGMTFDQLAQHYGCSVHAIQDAVKRLGVKPRPTGQPKGAVWTDERRANLRAATVDNPEWRAKMRENLLKRLPTMRGPSANSPLEKFLQAALMKAGIGFSTQRVLLGRYCVDILLHQAPVILEADGAFHHLREKQDAERDAALTAAGYRVFRFNGTEINRDAEECVAKVAAACSLTPDTDPVYDIRTGMMGSDNPNWNGGPQTVPCDYCGKPVIKDAFNARVMKRKFCDSKCYGAWMHEHPEESNRLLAIDWSDLASLYASGMTMRQLALHYGCGVHAVKSAMERQGITSRPPGRRRKDAPPQ
jgi:very-short-patch-repair endonuclease